MQHSTDWLLTRPPGDARNTLIVVLVRMDEPALTRCKKMQGSAWLAGNKNEFRFSPGHGWRGTLAPYVHPGSAEKPTNNHALS
jgi:hypothetical protein